MAPSTDEHPASAIDSGADTGPVHTPSPDHDTSTATTGATRGWSVLAVILLVAIMAAAAVVIWARLAGDPSVGSDGDAPTTLADGSTPPATPDGIADGLGLPVVMTSPLDGAATTRTCGFDAPGARGYLTPNSAVALATMPGGDVPGEVEFYDEQLGDGDVAVMCAATWADGTWSPLTPFAIPVDGPSMSSSGWLCCDPSDRSVGIHPLEVLDDAAWLLHDQGQYVVAYDVRDVERIGVPGEESDLGETQVAHVWMASADGAIVGEAYLGD